MNDKNFEQFLYHIENMNICYKEVLTSRKKIHGARGFVRKTIKTYIASNLGSIYNGFEFIFEQILKNNKIKLLKNDSWHKAILIKLNEIGFISEKMNKYLEHYRKYRHVWRHKYVNILEEKFILDLADEIVIIYNRLIKKIMLYIISELKKQPAVILPRYKKMVSDYKKKYKA